MNDILERLVAAFNDHPEDEAARAAALREVVAAHEGNLEELRDAVVTAFDTVHGKDSYEGDDIAAMGALVEAADVVSGELGARAEAAAQIDGFADKIAAVREIATPAEPSAPSAPSGPSLVEPVAEIDDNGGDVAEPVAAEPVAVAAAAVGRVPLGRLPNQHPAEPARGRTTYATTAASDVPDFGAGQPITDVQQLTKAAVNRLQSLARGGVHGSSRVGVATIHRTSQFSLNTDSGSEVLSMIEQVTSEAALPGGNLVAAGGWCAPSETVYDLCPVAATDGMWDVPGIQARRGGLRFPNVPDFSAIYSAVGFHQTEDEAAAGTKKTCYEIPCTDFTDVRMDVDGVCLKSPILTERAWPELVTYFTQQALAAHAHKLNAYKIASAAAQATKVTVTAGATPDKSAYGPGATAGLLGLIELQVEYTRYKYRMAQTATLEAVFPHWVLGILRSDLAKRNGVDLINVSNAQLISYLAARGVRAQFVYDWQDALATGTTTDFGGATNPVAWPAAVEVLLYPAGTFFTLDSDVITIDGLYDSTLLETNMHLALFTEEGVAVAKRCFQATLLKVPTCPDGGTGAQYQITCPAA